MLKVTTNEDPTGPSNICSSLRESGVFQVATNVVFRKRTLKHKLAVDIANWLPILFVGGLYAVLVGRLLFVLIHSAVRAYRLRSFAALLLSYDHTMFFLYGGVLVACWVLWQSASLLLFWIGSALYLSAVLTLHLTLTAAWTVLSVLNWWRISKAAIVLQVVPIPLVMFVLSCVALKRLLSAPVRGNYMRLYAMMGQIYFRTKIVVLFPFMFLLELGLHCLFGELMVLIWRTSANAVFKVLLIGVLVGIFPAFVGRKFNRWFRWRGVILPRLRRFFRLYDQKLSVDWTSVAPRQHITAASWAFNLEIFLWVCPLLLCEMLFWYNFRPYFPAMDAFLQPEWFIGRLLFVYCACYSSVWSSQLVLWQRTTVLAALRPDTLDTKDSSKSTKLFDEHASMTTEEIAAATPLSDGDSFV